MTFSHILQKSIFYLKKGSLPSVILAKTQTKLKSIIKSLTGFEWQHYYILSLQCESFEGRPADTPNNPNIKIATAQDWEDTSIIPELGVEKVKYSCNRCQNPDYCCIVYKQDHIICFGFISFKKLEFSTSFQYQLPDDEAFLYDAYCFLEYRRKGIYKMLLNERCQIIKDRGYKKISTIVTPANKPSWNGHKTWKKNQGFYWFKYRGKEFCTLKGYKPIARS